MCQWSGPFFAPQAVALREGRLLPPPEFNVPPIDLESIDWSAQGDQHRSVQWWMNGFLYLRTLLDIDEAQAGDDRIALDVLEAWAEANPLDTPSEFAWDGHTTAIRAEQLACLRAIGFDDEWLLSTIEDHGAFLSDSANYEGDWNHGLDQNIGLLALGCASYREDWKHIAAERTASALKVMVDEQGVSAEQATGYHFYVYRRIRDAAARFDACDVPFPEIERLALMPGFLAHAAVPDGTYTRIGDTLLKPLDSIPGTVAEFAATQGKSGPKPDSRFAVYDAGYVFGRSGWGETRPFEQESHYSLRFGPGRIIHGHNDHTSLTYFSRGSRIIVDGGFHGYSKDEWRAHFRTPQAHNVVYADGRFLWNSETKLVHQRQEPDWQSYTVQDSPYRYTRRHRSVLFVQEPIEAVIVLDRISGPDKTYTQAFHFDRGLTPQGSSLSGPTFVVDVHQMWANDGSEIVSGSAGYEIGKIEPVPSLITTRTGKDVTFLTVFVIRDKGEAVEVRDSAFKHKDKRRQISLRSGGKTAWVYIDNKQHLSMD